MTTGREPSLIERKLDIILAIDRIRDSTTDAQEMLACSVNTIATCLQAELCLISGTNEETGALELKAVDDRTGIFGQLEKGKAREAVEQSAAVERVTASETDPALRRHGLNYSLAAPLIVGGERLGSLLLFNRERPFDPAEVEMLEAAVSQADSALVQARTYRQLAARNKELEVVYRVDRIRDQDMDFQAMLNAVLNELCRAIQAEIGFIMLFNKVGQQLELKASTESDVFVVAEHYRLVQAAADEALHRAELIDRRNLNDRVRAIVCVPLILREEIIGVFGVINGPLAESQFGEEHRRLLRAIASQVDTAIFEDLITRRIRTIFNRYVNPQVVEEMLTVPDKDFFRGKRQVLTVLFSDMRGFTPISERTDPEILVNVLNDHLRAMTDDILAHQGTVDKFVGDEVMAIFGAPLPMDDHALRAVHTALAMQASQQELMARWTKAGGDVPPVGIGINTGEMIVGNIGCEKQTNYTVIGDSVNLASRLCGLAKPNQTLISQATYELVSDAVAINWLPPVHVKGKVEEVQIFEVVGLR